MYYRCISFNINQERNQVRDTIKNGARPRVCWKMAHQTVGPYTVEPATLGKMEARSAIIHRTVRWATGGSLRQRSTLRKVTVSQQSQKRRSQRAPDCPVWHRTVRCSSKTNVPNGQLLRTLTVALTWRAPDSALWLSGGAPDIANRIQPTARSGWEAINTPNHLIHYHPSILNSTFIARAKALHSKTQSKQSIHSKPQNQL
jgi:hypothetical protein